MNILTKTVIDFRIFIHATQIRICSILKENETPPKIVKIGKQLFKLLKKLHPIQRY